MRVYIVKNPNLFNKNRIYTNRKDNYYNKMKSKFQNF